MYEHICTCSGPYGCGQCQHCFRGIGPEDKTNTRKEWVYEGQIDNTQAENIIKDHVITLTKAHERLVGLVGKRGDQIMRWTKVHKETRLSMLKKAMPGMNDKKWPGRIADESEYVKNRKLNRNTWLLPFINSQTLSEDPAVFLRILDLATAQHPSKWCLGAFDMDSLVVGLLGQRYNPGQVGVDLSNFGQYSPETDCGQLHSKLAVGFPYAELILESQRLLLTFLEKLVANFLANKPLVEGNSTWLIEAEKKFRPAKWDTPEPYMNGLWSVFSLPMDPQALYTAAESKRAEAGQFLRDLQLNPLTLHRKIDKLKTTKSVTRYAPTQRWAAIASILFRPALFRYRLWEAITLRLQELVNVSDKAHIKSICFTDLVFFRRLICKRLTHIQTTNRLWPKYAVFLAHSN